ncbi:MAG: hypothetical protein U1E91_05380 [Moraxella sp.]
MKKPTNHLASRTERLANYQLPFQKKLQQLQQLTDDVRSAWQNVLTEEVLASLQVIACESFRPKVQIVIPLPITSITTSSTYCQPCKRSTTIFINLISYDFAW